MNQRRAAIVTAPRTIEFVTADPVSEDAGAVVVGVRGCGICGSNVPAWEGRPWFEYPLPIGAPGHEAWGEIQEVRDAESDLRVGDPVALLSTTALADTLALPSHDIVGLPNDLRGTIFPGEALGCGFNVARRSQFRAGDTVAVIGVGFIGAIVTYLAATAGARVIAVSRRPHSLDLARIMGAAETVVMDDHERILDTVGELTSGALCRVVVEAVGAQWPLDLGGELTAAGGRLVIAGYHQDGPRKVDMQLWNWRGIDVINAHERDREVVRQGVAEAARAVVQGNFDPSPLYTHVFPFEQLAAAMDAVVDRPAGFVKSLVTM